MDYIQEELRRQQRLWSGLMLGGQRRGAAEEDSAGDVRKILTDGSEDGVSPALQPGGKASSARSQLASRSQRRRQAVSRVLGLENSGTAAEKAFFTRGTEAETVTETVISYQSGDTGGMAGAQALSRMFQRDARRYDGAFPLY